LLDFENNQPYEVDYIGNMVIHDAEDLRLREIISNGWMWVNDVEDVDRLVYYTIQQNNEVHARESEEERNEIIQPVLTRYRQQRQTCCFCLVQMIQNNRALIMRHLSEEEVVLVLARAFACLSRSSDKRLVTEIFLESFESFVEFVKGIDPENKMVSQQVECFLDFLIKFTNACSSSRNPLPDLAPRVVPTVKLPVVDYILRAGSPKTSNGMLFTLFVSMLEKSAGFAGASLVEAVNQLPSIAAADSTVSYENTRLWNLFDAIIQKDPSTAQPLFQTIKSLMTAKLLHVVKIDQHCLSVYRALQSSRSA